MRRDSSARTWSSALFIFATIWKRSRICRASEHFSRMTFRLAPFRPTHRAAVLQLVQLREARVGDQHVPVFCFCESLLQELFDLDGGGASGVRGERVGGP